MSDCPPDDVLLAFYHGMIERVEEIDIIGDHLERCDACSKKLVAYSPSSYEIEFRDTILRRNSLGSEVEAILDQQLADADETSELVKQNVAPPSGIGKDKKGRFSKFRPQKRGHFLRCVKAFDQLLDQDVAIKIPREGFITSVDHRDQFYLDCCSYKNLSHPHILPLLDFGGWDGERHFICTPWIDAVPLDQWIEDHDVDLTTTLQIVARICSAVQHAHGNFVVHRHLDFRNVRMTEDGHVWLTDFGFVFDQRYQFELFENHKLLSPLLPSEFLDSDRGVDERSDIYSIGKILKFCFSHATASERSFVELLTPVVARSTAQSRSVRFQRMEDLMEAIAEVDSSLGYFRQQIV